MATWLIITGLEQRAYFELNELTRETEHPEQFWWDGEWEAASHVGKRKHRDSLRRRMSHCILHALRRADHT